MWEIVMKIWFAIIIFPGLVINEGYKLLKKHLAKHGIMIDWFDMTLLFLVILLVILLLNGYRP
ncbi:MAG: hypothetical protein WCT29_03360 [Candidatus Paceibacterota bacterium]|jgi:hypothetical protein